MPESFKSGGERVSLNVFPLGDLAEGISTIEMHESATILANADMQEYAISYRLSVDSESRIISFNLVDLPEMAEKSITQAEFAGIKIYY